jgi:hypothetical protein
MASPLWARRRKARRSHHASGRNRKHALGKLGLPQQIENREARSVVKEFLGDGVYADFDGYNLILTTENGTSVTNTIYLEPEVITALHEFLSRIRKEPA